LVRARSAARPIYLPTFAVEGDDAATPWHPRSPAPPSGDTAKKLRSQKSNAPRDD